MPSNKEINWAELFRKTIPQTEPIKACLLDYVMYQSNRELVFFSNYENKKPGEKSEKLLNLKLNFGGMAQITYGSDLFFLLTGFGLMVHQPLWVWRQIDKNPKPGLYFCTCEDGAGWHLIPCRISPRSVFFLRHIRTGILREGLI